MAAAAPTALTNPRPLRMRLDAHDETPPETPPAAPEAPPEPVADPKADKLGEAGTKALETERAARKAAEAETRRLKAEAADAQAKVQAFEDAQKSELEKAQAAAERAQAAVEAANRRAVTAELKAAASATFDDPDIVIALVGQDPTKYVTAAGDVDGDAITKALADLAERKPKLLKQATPPPAPAPVVEPPKAPKVPDPGQGPRGSSPEVDLMKATKEEFQAALAQFASIRI